MTVSADKTVVYRVRGLVQGIGFRPAIWKWANQLHLRGWIYNDGEGVCMAFSGPTALIEQCRLIWQQHIPAAAIIRQVDLMETLPFPVGQTFEILPSSTASTSSAGILADLATCPECLQEIFTPGTRRYQYPFTNCTSCGPRYSILEALPYDRVHTTMRHFTMCSDCRREYEDPAARRFHAQPIACPKCGPICWSQHADGSQRNDGMIALQQAAETLSAGGIVALKGIGGFHLMADARNEDAIQTLRLRKNREQKPFAVMFPTLQMAQQVCEIPPIAIEHLTSPATPIVLLRRKSSLYISDSVAPHTPWLGVFLPYTPLHHLLFFHYPFPLVATSGNRSDEPICYQNDEACRRLADIADCFVLHNRDIVRPADDSVLTICDNMPLYIRRARGFAPTYLPLSGLPDGWAAMGAQQKNTVAISCGGNVLVSPHIGDLDHAKTAERLELTLCELSRLHEIPPKKIATDLHPDYESTQLANQWNVPKESVQHHHAHIAACMLEHNEWEPVLGVAWDGTGLGTDNTLWGGEWLEATRVDFQRVGHIRPFRLPGGETAIREPRRSAIGLLWELDESLPHPLLQENVSIPWKTMLRQQINSPITTSMGRLFDAVSSLLGECQISAYEGQAAIQLENLVKLSSDVLVYPSFWREGVWDWGPMIHNILADVQHHISHAEISTRFHLTLATAIRDFAVTKQYTRVALSGGCFQNRILLSMTKRLLRVAHIEPLCPIQLPPNDACISAGQLTVLHARQMARENGSLSFSI